MSNYFLPPGTGDCLRRRGQRGRRAPQGKFASNPSITDLSYTAGADMRWGENLCMHSAMPSPIATGIHFKTLQTSLRRAKGPHCTSKCLLDTEISLTLVIIDFWQTI